MELSAVKYLDHAFNNPNSRLKRDRSLRYCYEGLQSLPDGLRILDYGTGPSLHQTVITAAKASEIVLSDYSATNREAIRLWLEDDRSAFDWLPHFRSAMSELENAGERELLERVEKIRRIVKAVVYCDLSQDPPIQKGYDVEYDVINSCFCLCDAAKSHEEYRQGIVKLTKYLKPGGILMVYESEHKKCHTSFYQVKDHMIQYVALTSEFVLKAFRDAGFSEMTLHTFELDPNHPSRIEYPDRVGYFHVRGVKRK